MTSCSLRYLVSMGRPGAALIWRWEDAGPRRGLCWSLVLLATYSSACSGLLSCNVNHPKLARATAVDSEGYTLLYNLLAKQGDVDRLLLIKAESPAVNTLIKNIAAACGNGAAKLQEFSSAESSLNLELVSLPAAEIATRESIESGRARALFFSTGKEFEVRLLLSQAEGLSYGAHLAAVLATREDHPARRAYLEYISGELSKLEDSVLKLIQERFRDLES